MRDSQYITTRLNKVPVGVSLIGASPVPDVPSCIREDLIVHVSVLNIHVAVLQI